MATLPINDRAETPAEQSRLRRPIDHAEWRKFANWALVWIALANIGFAAMWFVGAPPRHPEILAIGAIGLVVRHAPVWVKCVVFLCAMIYSILWFIAALFNLGLGSLVHSIQFFFEIKPANSIEYIVVAVAMVVVCAVAMRQMRREQGFTELRLVIMAIVLIASLAWVDQLMGSGMRGHYKRAADASTPFVSGTEQAGFAVMQNKPQRNLMLIMVESLGTPVGNAEMKKLLFAKYDSPAIAERFDVTTGNTVYYNSTTAGEIRELCGRWGDYDEFLDAPDSTCLPARLAKQGYETRAYHSFTGAFFDRTQWYPNIGFEHQQFAEDLLGRSARACGGVFPGVCDADMPALLAEDLKAADKPQFIYWLTVNSHLPVPPGMNLDVDNCETISPVLAEDYPMICRQFALWDQMDRAIIHEITASDFPATDILIVGDHMPPYFDRHHRSQFAPDQVPWLMLKWKDGSQGGQGAQD